ncbi:hypothetical protein [Streptomyces sp. NBC_00454]|uniref:hypothetical protein n=1 Tax=Streptomyces sp. NBC_00454 TaxID=2975747 RepID=UPI0030E1BF74
MSHKIARWAWFASAELPADLYDASCAVLRVRRPGLAPTLPHAASYDYPITSL